MAAVRLGPGDALASRERDVRLRIPFDGEGEPWVLCPAGDFFGHAWGKPAAEGCLLGTQENTHYRYLPMPFDRSARIELVSLREAGLAVAVRGEVLTADAPRRPWEGKLRAAWRREDPRTEGRPFTSIETKGRGHVVGLILQAQGPESGHSAFFEGEDQSTTDGELAIHGTGSEDFFNGGRYDVPGRWGGRRCVPLRGCLAYQRHLGRSGAHRLLASDAYALEPLRADDLASRCERGAGRARPAQNISLDSALASEHHRVGSGRAAGGRPATAAETPSQPGAKPPGARQAPPVRPRSLIQGTGSFSQEKRTFFSLRAP